MDQKDGDTSTTQVSGRDAIHADRDVYVTTYAPTGASKDQVDFLIKVVFLSYQVLHCSVFSGIAAYVFVLAPRHNTMLTQAISFIVIACGSYFLTCQAVRRAAKLLRDGNE